MLHQAAQFGRGGFARAFYLRSAVIDERQRRGDDIGVVERERERERESRQSEERRETRDESAKGGV